MQVSSSTNASLLDYINSQSADSSSKGLGKEGGISALLQQSCVASNSVLTKMSAEAAKSGIYKSTVTNASSVLKYLEALTDSSDKSVFSKAESESNSDEAVTKIGSLVVSYNKLLSNLSEEGGKTNKAYLKSLSSTVMSASEQLKKIGITVKSDGTLETDYATLCDADLSDLKEVFGSGSSLATALTKTVGEVNTASTRSSHLAQIYSTAYSNSGSYSQYDYIKHLYNTLA